MHTALDHKEDIFLHKDLGGTVGQITCLLQKVEGFKANEIRADELSIGNHVSSFVTNSKSVVAFRSLDMEGWVLATQDRLCLKITRGKPERQVCVEK